MLLETLVAPCYRTLAFWIGFLEF
uniref:Uncharacterized protein n=1 Tax=Rhizophora mucronata TaxID=61149 RepID=A0A2P2IMH4_RHIMU